MATKRGPGGASDAFSKPQEGTSSALSPAQEGTSSAPRPAQEGTSSSPSGSKLVGSVVPVVRPRTQVGRVRWCVRGGTMALFQAKAVPKQPVVELDAKEISSPGVGSSSQDCKQIQDDKNPTQGHLAGTSGTSAASQVGLWSLSFY